MRDATTTVEGMVLTVGVPAGLDATPTPDGLMLRRADAASRRQAYQMKLTVGEADSGPPVTLDRTRGSGDATIRYGLDRFDGGSGGEEVTLVATRACGSRTVRLRFDAQAEEGGEIDLEPAFRVLESVRCTPTQ